MTYTWVYALGLEQMEVRRGVSPTSTRLEVSGGRADPQVIDLDDHAALVTYHLGFERALIQSGWSFVEFQPNRREGADRRSMARPTDRRRAMAIAWSR